MIWYAYFALKQINVQLMPESSLTNFWMPIKPLKLNYFKWYKMILTLIFTEKSIFGTFEVKN